MAACLFVFFTMSLISSDCIVQNDTAGYPMMEAASSSETVVPVPKCTASHLRKCNINFDCRENCKSHSLFQFTFSVRSYLLLNSVLRRGLKVIL
jgi:hypothetical protein